MGEAHIVFTSPAGLSAYDQTIVLGGGLPPGGTQAFSIIIGSPAMEGDTVCFTVSLHALDDDANHTQCCNFYDCIVLPDCEMAANCLCDHSMLDIHLDGIVYLNIQPQSYMAMFQPRSTLCSTDKVYWYFTDSNVVEQTSGNEEVHHTFPGPGSYSVCMYVFRTEPNGEQCNTESCVDVEYIGPGATFAVYPNPNKGAFSIRINPEWITPLQLRVFDINSRVILQQQIENPAEHEFIPVNLEGIGSGVYMVEVLIDGKRWTKRVVIE